MKDSLIHKTTLSAPMLITALSMGVAVVILQSEELPVIALEVPVAVNKTTEAVPSQQKSQEKNDQKVYLSVLEETETKITKPVLLVPKENPHKNSVDSSNSIRFELAKQKPTSGFDEESTTTSPVVPVQVPVQIGGSEVSKTPVTALSPNTSAPIEIPVIPPEESQGLSAPVKVIDTTPVPVEINETPVEIFQASEENATTVETLEVAKPVERVEMPVEIPVILTQNVPLKPTENVPLATPKAPTRILASSNSVHQVRSGETLNSIARRYKISKADLVRVNNISNANLIKVNQELIIPGSNGIQPRESVDEIVVNKPKPQMPSIAQSLPKYEGSVVIPTESLNPDISYDGTGVTPINNRSSHVVGAAPIPVENYNPQWGTSLGTSVSPDLPPLPSQDEYLPGNQVPMNGYIWPSKGVLTSGYGMRWGRMHRGIDIAAPIGTPVVAAADGQVVDAGWNSGGYGRLVKIRHYDGSVSLYAHNSKLFVQEGQQVTQGQLIASMGSTGFSTGPHLHFEIHPEGRGAVNPMAFLPRKNSGRNTN